MAQFHTFLCSCCSLAGGAVLESEWTRKLALSSGEFGFHTGQWNKVPCPFRLLPRQRYSAVGRSINQEA